MNNNKYTLKWLYSWGVVISALALTGCQTGSMPAMPSLPSMPSFYKGGHNLYEKGIPGTARWAVLPFVNYSEAQTEQTVQLERILMVHLPAAGVVEPRLYPESVSATPSGTIAEAQKILRGKEWAEQAGMSFAITGDVYDWRFGEDGRGFVGINLEVFDIRTNEKLWTISGSGEGLPGESNFDVSRKLFTDLLSSLPVNRAQ